MTFRSLIDGEEHKDGSNRVTLRLPADHENGGVQQEVGQRFGWEEAAVLYQLDQHGWEIPITSEDQLNKAFADWDASSGPRTRLKYDTLFKEVECLLVDTEYPNSMLRGASASWELACRSSHHEMLGEGFIEALQALLVCGDFAPVCHAAASIHMLTQVERVCARFPRKLADSYHARSSAPTIRRRPRACRTSATARPRFWRASSSPLCTVFSTRQCPLTCTMPHSLRAATRSSPCGSSCYGSRRRLERMTLMQSTIRAATPPTWVRSGRSALRCSRRSMRSSPCSRMRAALASRPPMPYRTSHGG